MVSKIAVEVPDNLKENFSELSSHTVIDDFLYKYVDRREYEFIQMAVNSMYMSMAGEILDCLVKSDLKNE